PGLRDGLEGATPLRRDRIEEVVLAEGAPPATLSFRFPEGLISDLDTACERDREDLPGGRVWCERLELLGQRPGHEPPDFLCGLDVRATPPFVVTRSEEEL